jgi:hypothetical protein
MNPFNVLGVSPSASVAQVKLAYKKLIRQYHPDKVRSLPRDQQAQAMANYQLVENAYEQIMRDYHTAQPSDRLTMSEPVVPQTIDRFEINHFNRVFNTDRSEGHNIYGVDPTQTVQRDRASYNQERSQVDRLLGGQQPMFRGSFNQNSFNQAFVQTGATMAPVNNTGQLIPYVEPSPMTNAMVQYTDTTFGASHGLTSLGYDQYGQQANQVQNPVDWSQIDPSRDIMRETPMDPHMLQAKIEERRGIVDSGKKIHAESFNPVGAPYQPVGTQAPSDQPISTNEQLQAHYMQMQTQLLENLNRLLESRNNTPSKPVRKSAGPVQIVDDRAQRMQIAKLETELAQLRKKVSVQDSLLKNVKLFTAKK